MSETNGNATPSPSPDEARKLLGGYATGTLSPAERQLLFDAALGDDALFAELMREDALREAFEAPGAKDELLAALEEKPVPWHERLQHWLGKPAVLAVGGSLAAAAVLLVGLGQYRSTAVRVQAPELAVVERSKVPETNAVPPVMPAPTLSPAQAPARSKQKADAPEKAAPAAAPVATLRDAKPEPVLKKAEQQQAEQPRNELRQTEERKDQAQVPSADVQTGPSQQAAPGFRQTAPATQAAPGFQQQTSAQDALSRQQKQGVAGNLAGALPAAPPPPPVFKAREAAVAKLRSARTIAATGAASATPTAPVALGPVLLEQTVGSLKLWIEGEGENRQLAVSIQNPGTVTIAQGETVLVPAQSLDAGKVARIPLSRINGTVARLRIRLNTAPANSPARGFRPPEGAAKQFPAEEVEVILTKPQ